LEREKLIIQALGIMHWALPQKRRVKSNATLSQFHDWRTDTEYFPLRVATGFLWYSQFHHFCLSSINVPSDVQ